MSLHDLLDYYKFNCRKSEYLKIRPFLIDQAATKVESSGCLIEIRQLPARSEPQFCEKSTVNILFLEIFPYQRLHLKKY